MSPPIAHVSPLAILLAQLASSLGFITSVLAICFHWLLPALKPSVPRYRPPIRAPLTPKSPVILRRSSLICPPPSPALVSPSLPARSTSPRRVSFNLITSPISHSKITPRRRQTLGAVPVHQPEVAGSSFSIRSSASSSSSTLVNPTLTSNELMPGHDPFLHPESGEDYSNIDSDVSHLSSTSSIRSKPLSLSAHFPNVKKALIYHKRRTSAPAASPTAEVNPAPSPTASDAPPKTPRRSSLPFWPTPRKDNTITITNLAPDPETTPKSSRVSFSRRLSLPRPRTPPTPSTPVSPSFFTRKPERRSSTPAPRTQPYGPPYYAPMPTPALESVPVAYTSYLKRLPQFEADLTSPLKEERSDDPLTSRNRH